MQCVQQRIRYLFDQTKLTQTEFALMLGIGQPHLSGIMGERKPSRRLLVVIAERTGAHLDWLLHGSGEIYIKRAEPSHDPPELAGVISKARTVWPKLQNDGRNHEVAVILLRDLDLP